MTRDEMKALELNETKRSNLANEKLEHERNKVQMISALVNAGTRFIPGTSFSHKWSHGGKDNESKQQ